MQQHQLHCKTSISSVSFEQYHVCLWFKAEQRKQLLLSNSSCRNLCRKRWCQSIIGFLSRMHFNYATQWNKQSWFSSFFDNKHNDFPPCNSFQAENLLRRMVLTWLEVVTMKWCSKLLRQTKRRKRFCDRTAKSSFFHFRGFAHKRHAS